MTEPFVIPAIPTEEEFEDTLLEMAKDHQLCRLLTIDDWNLVSELRLERERRKVNAEKNTTADP